MNVRLKTSKNVDFKLDEMNSSLRLSTKAALARIAVSYSLRIEEDPRVKYTPSDQQGFEFQRLTLTGDNDQVIKAMIIEHIQEPITDEEYYPGLLNAHIERGIELLYSELKYAGNREKFFTFLLNVGS